MQKLTDKNRLSTTYPEIAAQWHQSKNGDLTPDDVSFGSGKKVWWQCLLVEDHIWQANISARTVGEQGCSCCAGKTVVASNSFATNHPGIAAQWHPTKNGDLTPDKVVQRSNRKVWWKCPVADDHEWESSPDGRVKSPSCPFCCGTRVCNSNSLGANYPNVAETWHPTRNGDLTPFDLVSGSVKRVWWKCPVADDHEWLATPADRIADHGCPCCNGVGRGKKIVASNCLETTHPKLMEKWDYAKNTISPKSVSAGSHLKVWWKCPVADDHEWEAVIQSVATRDEIGNGCCPCCSGHKVVPSNCLETTYPHLVKLWHPTRNGDLTPKDVVGGGRRKVWWKCPEGDDHEWEADIINVVNGSGCPCCLGRRIVDSNSLAAVKPEVVPLWHNTKNGELTPETVAPYSSNIVWWKCPVGEDHEWQASIANVAKGSGCACCCNRKVVPSNCLATTHPEFVQQWDVEKNDLTPFDVTAGSCRKVWWKCDVDPTHVWRASPNNRFAKKGRITGCPQCGIKRRAEKNSWWITELFVERCKLRHGDRYNYNDVVYSGFHEKVKIGCQIHGQFLQTAYLHLHGSGCPACAGIVQKTTDEFIAKAREVHGDKFDYSKSKYIARTKKLTIICPVHGEFRQRPSCHLKGNGCYQCCLSKPLDTAEYIEKAIQVHGSKYGYANTVYSGSDQKVKITCFKHGDFEQTATSHLAGCDCPKCAAQSGIEKRTMTLDEFVSRANKVHGNKYQYHKSVYVNCNTKVTIVCPKHGDFEQRPLNHIHALASCPKCRESKGETRVRRYLENRGIQYKYNHRFASCKNVKPMPFDFVVWFNGKLHLIEYQGKQHYVPIPKWHGEDAQEELEKVRERDRMKAKWCEERNLPLLQFPYWKTNQLDAIIDDFLGRSKP